MKVGRLLIHCDGNSSFLYLNDFEQNALPQIKFNKGGKVHCVRGNSETCLKGRRETRPSRK